MSSNLLIIAIVFATLLAGVLAWLLIKQRRAAKPPQPGNPGHPPTPPHSGTLSQSAPHHPAADTGSIPSRQLQLQAYERLILVTDRNALPHLIPRGSQAGASSREK